MQNWKFDPARDLGVAGSARARSVRRENGMFETMPVLGCRLCLRTYFWLVHRLRLIGAEHLPSRPPFVIVANHTSHLDALALSSVLPLAVAGRTFPLAAGDAFFETPATAWCAAWMLNALPLWRKNVGPHAMEQLRRRLTEEPCGYVLFPEGTRSRDGSMARFRPGLGMLLAETDVPVVPCWLQGAFQALPPNRRLPSPRRLELRVGAPRTFPHVSNDREGWMGIAGQLEAEVRALSSLPADGGN